MPSVHRHLGAAHTYEINCLKYESYFVCCSESINFNGTAHTIKQETYVWWNIFHATHQMRCMLHSFGHYVFCWSKWKDYNKLHEIYFLNVHRAANIFHAIYLWNTFQAICFIGVRLALVNPHKLWKLHENWFKTATCSFYTWNVLRILNQRLLEQKIRPSPLNLFSSQGSQSSPYFCTLALLFSLIFLLSFICRIIELITEKCPICHFKNNDDDDLLSYDHQLQCKCENPLELAAKAAIEFKVNEFLEMLDQFR